MNTFSSSKPVRLAVALAAAVAGLVTLEARNWNAGDPAPALAELGVTGSLPELQGKVTLIDFWASWCVPCKASFPEMESVYQEYRDKGFQVVAINLDTNEKAMQRFLDRQSASFAIVRDTAQNTVKSAGIDTFPTSFLIDKNGVIRFVHEGWHGRKSRDEIVSEINTLLSE